MLRSLSAALLALALLASPLASAEPPFPSICETGVRYLELTADTAGNVPAVCIRPGLSTTLFFDSKLAGVQLANRGWFRRVKWDDDSVMLVPSETLPDGERLLLTVHFQGDEAPTSATFLLVVHPFQVERQLEVSRHPRSVSSYQQETQQVRVQARECREEKKQLQAECGGHVGLTGPLLHGWIDDGGVASRRLMTPSPNPSALLSTSNALSYRAVTRFSVHQQKVWRLAVALMVTNRGTEPWTAAGGALVRERGESLREPTVRQLEPIPPGGKGIVVLEVEAMAPEAQGTFTLKLWSADGGEGVTLGGVTFP